MNQEERLNYLVKELIDEEDELKEVEIPEDYQEKRRLLRALMNIRMPKKASRKFLKIQDEFLQEEAEDKGIIYAEICRRPQSGAGVPRSGMPIRWYCGREISRALRATRL